MLGKCSLPVRQKEELLQDTFSCHQLGCFGLDGRRCSLRAFRRWSVSQSLVHISVSYEGLWWAGPGRSPAWWAHGSVCATGMAETGSGSWAPDRWGSCWGETELNWTQAMATCPGKAGVRLRSCTAVMLGHSEGSCWRVGALRAQQWVPQNPAGGSPCCPGFTLLQFAQALDVSAELLLTLSQSSDS